MRKKLNFAAIISCILIPSCACADLPYLNYSVDLQLPGSPLNLDCTYVGNTPLLKFFVFDNDVPYTASGYTWTFFYGSSPTATSGVSMASYNISSNAVSFFSATNLFSRSGLYYVSLIMTSTSGLRRTVASGTMKQKFDAGANLPGISPYVYPFNWNLYSSFIGQWPISSANSALLITTNGTNGSLILAVQTGVATNGFNGVVNTYGGTNNASFDGSSRILTMNFAPISAASTNGINSVAYTTNNAGIITFSGNILSSGTNLPASGAGSITNVASGDTNFVFVTGGAGPNTVVAPTSRATNDFALAEGAYPSSNPSGFAGSNSVSLRLASNTWAAADSTTNYALRTAFNASTNALWANFAQYLLLGGGTMTGTVLFTTPISTFGISGSTNLASGYNGLSLVDNWGHQTVDWYPTSDKTSPGPLLAGDVMYYNLGVWSGYPITNLFQSWLQSNVWDAANGLAVTNNRLTSNAIPALTARDTNWLTAVTGQVSVTSRATNDFALAENASNTAGNLINVSTAVLARISSFDASNSFYAASNPSGFAPQSPLTNPVNASGFSIINQFRSTAIQTNGSQVYFNAQNNQNSWIGIARIQSAILAGTNYSRPALFLGGTNKSAWLTFSESDGSLVHLYSSGGSDYTIWDDSNVSSRVDSSITWSGSQLSVAGGGVSNLNYSAITNAPTQASLSNSVLAIGVTVTNNTGSISTNTASIATLQNSAITNVSLTGAGGFSIAANKLAFTNPVSVAGTNMLLVITATSTTFNVSGVVTALTDTAQSVFNRGASVSNGGGIAGLNYSAITNPPVIPSVAALSNSIIIIGGQVTNNTGSISTNTASIATLQNSAITNYNATGSITWGINGGTIYQTNLVGVAGAYLTRTLTSTTATWAVTGLVQSVAAGTGTVSVTVATNAAGAFAVTVNGPGPAAGAGDNMGNMTATSNLNFGGYSGTNLNNLGGTGTVSFASGANAGTVAHSFLGRTGAGISLNVFTNSSFTTPLLVLNTSDATIPSELMEFQRAGTIVARFESAEPSLGGGMEWSRQSYASSIQRGTRNSAYTGGDISVALGTSSSKEYFSVQGWDVGKTTYSPDFCVVHSDTTGHGKASGDGIFINADPINSYAGRLPYVQIGDTNGGSVVQVDCTNNAVTIGNITVDPSVQLFVRNNAAAQSYNAYYISNVTAGVWLTNPAPYRVIASGYTGVLPTTLQNATLWLELEGEGSNQVAGLNSMSSLPSAPDPQTFTFAVTNRQRFKLSDTSGSGASATNGLKIVLKNN